MKSLHLVNQVRQVGQHISIARLTEITGPVYELSQLNYKGRCQSTALRFGIDNYDNGYVGIVLRMTKIESPRVTWQGLGRKNYYVRFFDTHKVNQQTLPSDSRTLF